jgi:hypothetical protein
MRIHLRKCAEGGGVIKEQSNGALTSRCRQEYGCVELELLAEVVSTQCRDGVVVCARMCRGWAVRMRPGGSRLNAGSGK